MNSIRTRTDLHQIGALRQRGPLLRDFELEISSAMVDAIRLELMRLTQQDESVERAVEDYCWGV